jgi:hypothetical protein
MIRQSAPYNKLFLFVIAGLECFTLSSQFYLIIQNRTASVIETVIRYFSFFTILTNLAIALTATFILLIPNSRQGKFFSKPSTLSAIAVYIIVVGIIYNTILRFQWQPKGWQLIIDELLHAVLPLLYTLFWIFFVPKNTLKWKDILPWMIFPMLYIVWTMMHGAFSGFYPYPFVDVGVLGYPKVILNGVGMVAFFIVASCILIGIGKTRKN